MSNQDWLSLTEIARLWSDETGESAEALERDLQAWFLEFVASDPSQQPGSPDRDGDTTNRLIGMLGARYLERSTFETYCEERGYSKPRFWSAGRDDDSWRDKPSQPEPAPSRPDATPPQSSEEPSDGRYAHDPQLAAFQAQIASLGERLEADRTETTTMRKRSAADQQNHDSDRGRTETLPEPGQQELIERAAAASAEASDLKAQILAAEQQIADLSAEIETRRVSAVARPSAPGRGTPSNDPMTGQGPEPRSFASYSNPHATSQLLRKTTPRGKRRGRVALVAGFAALLVVLFLWGGRTVIQLASNEPIPPPAPVAPAERIQPELAQQSPEPVTGKLGNGGEVLQQPEVPRASGSADGAAVEASEVAQTREQRLASQAISAEVEIAGLRVALKQTEELAAQADSARYAAEAAAADARAALASAEQKAAALAKQLNAAQQRFADLELEAQNAKAEAKALATELAETWRIQQTASAHAAFLDQGLDAAQRRIADLEAEASTAKTEAASLKDQLAKTHTVHATALEKIRAEGETTRQELLLAAETAAAATATREGELDAALERITHLETTLQSLDAIAEKLAKELQQGRKPRAASGQNDSAQAGELPEQTTSAPVEGPS